MLTLLHPRFEILFTFPACGGSPHRACYGQPMCSGFQLSAPETHLLQRNILKQKQACFTTYLSRILSLLSFSAFILLACSSVSQVSQVKKHSII